MTDREESGMRDSISKVDVLETYGDLYDVFEDNKFIRIEIDKVYDKLNKLKEPEPMPVIAITDGVMKGFKVGLCPSCYKTISNTINNPTRYCKFCGQGVKWDEQTI